MTGRRTSLHIALLVIVALATGASAIEPFDALTWWMEALPVLIGAALLITTYRRFPLTDLLYVLIALHALILVYGAHYTYARVPLGDWVALWFDFERNHYDRIGHIAQGFVPAILAREILLRTSPLERGGWLFYIVVSVCLAFSAFYELLEWASAVVMADGASDFLGSQGDVWDAQWDMFLALCGAIAALLLLSRWHDRQLRSLSPRA